MNRFKLKLNLWLALSAGRLPAWCRQPRTNKLLHLAAEGLAEVWPLRVFIEPNSGQTERCVRQTTILHDLSHCERLSQGVARRPPSTLSLRSQRQRPHRSGGRAAGFEVFGTSPRRHLARGSARLVSPVARGPRCPSQELTIQECKN